MGRETMVRLKDPKTQIGNYLRSAGYNVAGKEVSDSNGSFHYMFRGENYLVEVFMENGSGLIAQAENKLKGHAINKVEIVGDYEFPIECRWRETEGWFYKGIWDKGVSLPQKRDRDIYHQRYSRFGKELLKGEDYKNRAELLNVMAEGIKDVLEHQDEKYS